MIFTKSSDIPDGVNDVLGDIAATSAGVTISSIISSISTRLSSLLASGSQNDPVAIDDSDVEMFDGKSNLPDYPTIRKGYHLRYELGVCSMPQHVDSSVHRILLALCKTAAG